MSEERPTLFLIAHKVRGEPAFDIAITIEIGAEDGWIIPTSGHRAYPYWYINLDQLYPRELLYAEDIDGESVGEAMLNGQISCPQDWPDHYRITAMDRARELSMRDDLDLIAEAARPGEGKITNLASLLGLDKPKPVEPIKRRV